MESAASFLAARPRSVAEVRRRLRHHGYREELVEIVLSRLTELGYLDEEAFAQAWVVSRDRARPRGERALRRELIQKGIDRETIAAVLADRTASAAETGKDPTVGGTPARETEADSPDEQAARRLLERRRSSLLRETDPLKRRQKAYALLARNGFDPEICRAVASSFAAAQADEPAGP